MEVTRRHFLKCIACTSLTVVAPLSFYAPKVEDPSEIFDRIGRKLYIGCDFGKQDISLAYILENKNGEMSIRLISHNEMYKT